MCLQETRFHKVSSALTIMNSLITLHVYKERTDALDLRGQNSCSILETHLNTGT